MRFGLAISTLSVAMPILAFSDATVRLAQDAALRLGNDDARLELAVYRDYPGNYLETVNEDAHAVAGDISQTYRFVAHGKVWGTGRCTLRKDGGKATFAGDLTAYKDISAAGMGWVLSLNAERFKQRNWSAGDKRGAFPEAPGKSRFFSGKAKEFVFADAGGVKWRLFFNQEVEIAISDRRLDRSDDFVVAFMPPGKLKMKRTAMKRMQCVVECVGGKVDVGVRDFHAIGTGGDWVALDWTKAIKAGSPLDFSKLTYRHLTPGGDGALVVTNGELYFRNKPKKPARFLGATLYGNAAFANKNIAQQVSKRFVRLGYNSVRLTGFDRELFSGKPADGGVNRNRATELDFLIQTLEREGLDVFLECQDVRKHTWAEIGATPPPDVKEPSARLVNAMAMIDERAFGVWREFATLTYGRKSTKRSSTIATDPAMPLMAPMSGGCVFSACDELILQPKFVAGYTKWLSDQRKANDNFMAGSVCEPMDLKLHSKWGGKYASVRRYMAELERAGMARQNEFLKSLKTKALMVANPGECSFGDVARYRGESKDVFIMSFSVDSPHYLGEKWSLPCRINNANPFCGKEPISHSLAQHSDSSHPFGISEWSMTAPSSWRAGIGLYLGARAAHDRWDVIWRATYASHGDGMAEDRAGVIGSQYMDDPMAIASERAIGLLYLRGDFDPDEDGGCELQIADGALTVRTPRTAGGFSPSPKGKIEAGPMVAQLAGSPAAVWVSSLSDKPIESASKLLITHLTDMQMGGTLFSDSRAKLMMKRGNGRIVVRNGTAEVKLSVNRPRGVKVYALKSDGTRMQQLKTTVADGTVSFVLEVRGPKTAQYLYEVVCE